MHCQAFLPNRFPGLRPSPSRDRMPTAAEIPAHYAAHTHVAAHGEQRTISGATASPRSSALASPAYCLRPSADALAAQQIIESAPAACPMPRARCAVHRNARPARPRMVVLVASVSAPRTAKRGPESRSTPGVTAETSRLRPPRSDNEIRPSPRPIRQKGVPPGHTEQAPLIVRLYRRAPRNEGQRARIMQLNPSSCSGVKMAAHVGRTVLIYRVDHISGNRGSCRSDLGLSNERAQSTRGTQFVGVGTALRVGMKGPRDFL